MSIAIVGGVVVGAMTADDSADSQSAAAGEASKTQIDMYNQNRKDTAPWRDVGVGGLSGLANMAGIEYLPGGVKTYDQIYNSLKQKYTTQDTQYQEVGRGPQGTQQIGNTNLANGEYSTNSNTPAEYGNVITTTVDEPALKAETERLMAEQTAKQEALKSAEGFGSMNKDFTLADFQKDPGYQFRFDEGQKGIENSAASRGGALSGATLKQLSRYGQDYAAGEYQNAYNRYNNDKTSRFNRLATLSGVGQTANSAIGNAGTNMANNVSSNQLQAGNAQAAGTVGVGNAVTNGINNYQQSSYLNNMNKSNSGGGTVSDSDYNTYWMGN